MNIEKTDFLLTIAIPTYNRKNLLKRALESIVPQLNPKIEVLVSDNASDDGTNEMMAQSFPMVRYIKNETNQGSDYNFLQCYREATGKYVILFGSDDRMSAGAIDYLTNFLENNDCDLVFLNYRFFDVTKKEIYIKEWIKNYSIKQDIVTTDRSLFMKYAGDSITFMSASIVKRSLLAKVNEPKRFIGTDYIHANIMLEAVKGINTKFGVIMQPFIEEDATPGNSTSSKELDRWYTVFGKHLYTTLCIQGPKCGFQKKQMRKVYLQYLHNCPPWSSLLSFKRRNNVKAIENFWKDGYPVVKKYPIEWMKVVFVAITPQFIIQYAYKVHKSLVNINRDSLSQRDDL